LQSWASTSASQVEESLSAIKAAAADLDQRLGHLRSRTNMFFHDISDLLTAMQPHVTLLEDTLEQSRVGHLPEVEKFLATIKSAAVHLQALLNPGG
jgi:hypothetical protein